jgi:arylsulfatase
MNLTRRTSLGVVALFAAVSVASMPASAQQQEKRPNVVMLMTDDTGWN